MIIRTDYYCIKLFPENQQELILIKGMAESIKKEVDPDPDSEYYPHDGIPYESLIYEDGAVSMNDIATMDEVKPLKMYGSEYIQMHR